VKNRKRSAVVERVYLEALLIGLCIGLAAVLLDRWVGGSSWQLRIGSLLVLGGGICLLQYWLARVGRR